MYASSSETWCPIHAHIPRSSVPAASEIVPETPPLSQEDDAEIAPPVLDGSQTQAETQLMLETQEEEMDVDNAELKRKTTGSSDGNYRKNKKVKISIGPAVDLGD